MLQALQALQATRTLSTAVGIAWGYVGTPTTASTAGVESGVDGSWRLWIGVSRLPHSSPAAGDLSRCRTAPRPPRPPSLPSPLTSGECPARRPSSPAPRGAGGRYPHCPQPL